MRRLYHGSCHCGAIRFEVAADVAAGTEKCNCSICTKMRLWSVKVAPEALRLIAGAEEIADYTFGSGVAHHFFCRRCGVRPYERVDLPPPGAPYLNINLMCLDDLDLQEVIAAPVLYMDGLHDAWERVPAEIRHL